MGCFYLIGGNEEFLVKERAGVLIRSLCGENPEENPDLEIIRGDTESERFTVTLDRLIDSLETHPFLSPQKMIWLKHFNKFDDAFAEKTPKKVPSRIDRLSAFLKDGLPKDVVLIIDAIGLDRRKAFYKLCEKVCEESGGKVEWFDKADPKAKGAAAVLMRRIREAVSETGKRMDDDAAAYLAEIAGGDAGSLKSEIEKLVSYTGENQRITLADCREICSRSDETLSWEFSSALAEKNPAKALELIPGIMETMMQERGASTNAEIALVGAVNSEFKRLAAIRSEAARFQIPDRASADFFYNLAEAHKGEKDSILLSLHPYRAFMIWNNLRRFSDKELAKAFQYILQANLALVTGSIDSRLALESLVMNITGGGEGTSDSI